MDNNQRKELFHASGEKHPMAKLNKPQVSEIRNIYSKGGISQRMLARLYNVGQPQIGRILRNESWIGGVK